MNVQFSREIDNTKPNSHILVIEEATFRKTILLEESAYSIGRDTKNTIVVKSKKVSRFHATLLRRIDAKNKAYSYWILDGDLQGNRSTNGVFINNKRCLLQELNHGDFIKLGHEVQFTYYLLNNPKDISYFQRQDFEDQEKDQDNDTSTAEKLEDKQKKTIFISEANVEEEDKASDLEKLASFPELSPNPIIEINWNGDLTYINPAGNKKFRELLKSQKEKTFLKGLTDHCNNENVNLLVREINIGNQIFEQYIHYLREKKLIRTYLFDCTKRKQLEKARMIREQRYRAIIRQTTMGIFLVDFENKKIIEANNAYCDLIGYTLEEIKNAPLYKILSREENQLDQKLEAISIQKNNLICQGLHRTKQGKFIRLEMSISPIDSGPQNILSFTIGSSLTSKDEEEKISFYDLLTGLPSRTLFNEQLSTALANAKRNKDLIAVLVLELKDLYQIKNNLGDEVGDRLFQGVAKRLRSCLRSGDTIATWNSNKFAALLPQVKGINNIAKISRRILDAVKQPFNVNQKKIQLQTNMGIAVYNKDGEDSESLVNSANKALLKSYEKGKNNYQFFSNQFQKEANRLIRIENNLQRAIDREQFYLEYQPRINLKTKNITGIEAFVRWKHPELGEIAPNQFISLAEETGLILPIGNWIMKTACFQYQTWKRAGLLSSEIPITINLSALEFQQPNLLARLSSILEETKLEPHLLELEITETTLMKNIELATKILADLGKIGVKLSLDDFGTGYSAIGYLKQFSFDTLKIDRSLISELKKDDLRQKEFGIISALIDLGGCFNLSVIAEGVENEEQLEILLNLGCDEIQGNLFSSPLNVDSLSNFLSSPNFNFLNFQS